MRGRCAAHAGGRGGNPDVRAVELVRAGVGVVGKFDGPMQIGFAGAVGETVQFEGIDQFLAQRAHDGLLVGG